MLFRKLVMDGKNVTFDYSFMEPGRDFWDSIFFELSRTNCVLLIVTPSYKSKSLGLERGGLKREFDEIVRLANTRPDMKVIPIVRQGDFPYTIPEEFSSRFAIDMRDGQREQDVYEELLKVLA